MKGLLVPDLLSMEPWAAAKKNFQLVWRCHQLQSRILPLAPSVASVANDKGEKGDNEIILGAVYRSPGICLTAEEKPRKPQLGNRLMKGLYNQSSPKLGYLFLQMRSVGSQTMSGREKEGSKERTGRNWWSRPVDTGSNMGKVMVEDRYLWHLGNG